jgi:hypothetical protein
MYIMAHIFFLKLRSVCEKIDNEREEAVGVGFPMTGRDNDEQAAVRQ